ncbi:MAG: Uma2 family endonuclease [Acidobacteria bacterium]|nr:Uma2 family endonuclease [Acidobacteriota bacterium]MBI3281827.1 Uma2 family endonuclease [Acidobacteriota bacterium]
MPTKTLVSVEEYLHTSFEPDAEFVDGEVVERNVGEIPRAAVEHFVQLKLAAVGGLRIHPNVRVQITPTRFRVPDVAAWRTGPIGARIPAVPPFLVVEILSPEDRMVRVQPKINEYLAVGAEWIWVIDPLVRSALVYSQAKPTGELSEVPYAENPRVEIPLAEMFAALDSLE